MTSAVCVLNDGNSNVATLGEYYGQVVRSPYNVRSAYRLPAGLSSKRPSLSVVTQKTALAGVSLILESSS
jgi:hypothetical protein